MAIVKGTGGALTLASGVISSNDYTIFIGVKTPDPAQFGNFFDYFNTGAGDYITVQFWDGVIHHRTDQQFTAQAIDNSATGATANTWELCIASCDSTTNSPFLETVNGTYQAGGSHGTYQANASPNVNVLGDSPVGDRIGVIAIYAAELDATDRAHLMAGNDPTNLPSATAPTALWIDSAGVSKDGSDNLISWTDEIGSLVLTPSGTVTVDDADLVPVTYGAPTSTAGISTKTLERLGVGVSATAADVFVWSGHNVDMVTTAADLKVLGATITSGVLQAIDLSSTAIAVGGNITVVVVPASGGPGIAIETTAEDIA